MRAAGYARGLLSWAMMGLIVAVFFWTPGEKARAQEVFGGVGVLLDRDPNNPASVLIFSVTYKSPADKAKIKRGERLLKIDGADVGTWTLAQMAQKIRGPVGSMVTLTLSSAAVGTRDVPLTREVIKSGPIVHVPPPTARSTGTFFTEQEKTLIKQKIMSLQTDEQRERMLNLLQALKSKQITKAAFMKFLKSDF